MLIQSNNITLFNAAYTALSDNEKKSLVSIHGILNMEAVEFDLYTISYIFLVLNLTPTAIKLKIPPHVISFLKSIEKDLVCTQKTLLENIYSNKEVEEGRISNMLLGNVKTFAKYATLVDALNKGVRDNYSVKKENDKLIFRKGDEIIGQYKISQTKTNRAPSLRFFSPVRQRTPIRKKKPTKRALKKALEAERKQSCLR